jgi:hypothetical protein
MPLLLSSLEAASRSKLMKQIRCGYGAGIAHKNVFFEMSNI